MLIDRMRFTWVMTDTPHLVCVVWLMLRWPVCVAHPMACDTTQPSRATHKHMSALEWRCTTEHVMHVDMTCCEPMGAYVCVYITWHEIVCVNYYTRWVLYVWWWDNRCGSLTRWHATLHNQARRPTSTEMPLGYDAPPTMDTKMDVRMPLNQTVISGLYSKQTRGS